MEEHKETCSHRQTHKHITVWNAVKQRRLNPSFHHQPSTQVHSSNFRTPIQLLHYIFTSNVQYFTQIQHSSKIRNPRKRHRKNWDVFFLPEDAMEKMIKHSTAKANTHLQKTTSMEMQIKIEKLCSRGTSNQPKIK